MNLTAEQYDIMKIMIGAKSKKNTFANKHKYNAQKSGGYDSKLEHHMAGLLKLHKVNFKEKEVFELQEKFTYGEQKIRSICIIPDFIILNGNYDIISIVDTKGMITPDWKIKIKLLKAKLLDENKVIPIYTPKNKGECQEVINRLTK